MDKLIQFTCPGCGSHDLIRVHENATFVQPFDGVMVSESDSDVDIGDNGEIIQIPQAQIRTDYTLEEKRHDGYLKHEGDIHFECGSCKYEITDERGDILTDDDEMKDWIMKNQEKTVP